MCFLENHSLNNTLTVDQQKTIFLISSTHEVLSKWKTTITIIPTYFWTVIPACEFLGKTETMVPIVPMRCFEIPWSWEFPWEEKIEKSCPIKTTMVCKPTPFLIIPTWVQFTRLEYAIPNIFHKMRTGKAFHCNRKLISKFRNKNSYSEHKSCESSCSQSIQDEYS